MTLKAWPHGEPELVADMGVFRLLRMSTRSPRTGAERSVSVLEAADWVNVAALTPEREIVLVRQFRHGTREFTLEIPGGMVDEGESADQAAQRELLEETGYAGDGPVLLGVVAPNPAIQGNRCHTFLFENCRRVREPELDHGEDIEVATLPLMGIPGVVAAGGVDHALVLCAFWWLALRRPDLFRIDAP